MNKILWFVKYGPDSSHMWEAKSFDKLKDAREFANNLPLSPTGGVRPRCDAKDRWLEWAAQEAAKGE